MSKTARPLRTEIHGILTALGAEDIMWDGTLATFTVGEREYVLSAGDRYGVSAVYLGPKVGDFEWPRHYLEKYGAKPVALKVGTRRSKHLKEQILGAIRLLAANWSTLEATLQSAESKRVNNIVIEAIMNGPFRSYRLPSSVARDIVTECARGNVTTLHGFVDSAIKVMTERTDLANWRMFTQVASSLLTIEDVNAALRKSLSSPTKA